MTRGNGIVGRGVLAGLLSATALILWFFVLDLIAGTPLRAPRFLASALFTRGRAEPGVGLIALYTVLHYAVFLAVGIFMAWVARTVRLHFPFLIAIVLGFLLFDLVFYASVIISGRNVVESLGWPAVLGGSILAGLVLVGTLHFTGGARGVTLRALAARHPVVRDGVIAGLIGAVTFAVWFLVIDAISRRPFFTPGALGSLVLLGAGSPTEVQISLATVLGFTLIHLTVFVLLGLIAAALFIGAERQPALMLAFVLVFATLAAAYVGLIPLTAFWLSERLGWWALLGGGVFAAVAMVAYLWWQHPAVVERLRESPTVDRPSD